MSNSFLPGCSPVDFSQRYELPYWTPYSMSVEPPKYPSVEQRSIRMVQPVPFFQASSPTTVRKEIDDLARKQEEFILRCQYPKRILPSELKAEGKKSYYTERRRERSTSPNEGRRKSTSRHSYRGYSPGGWRNRRREDRSESRSPRTRTEFSPANRTPPATAEPAQPLRNK